VHSALTPIETWTAQQAPGGMQAPEIDAHLRAPRCAVPSQFESLFISVNELRLLEAV
jgi:hypothetical protein